MKTINQSCNPFSNEQHPTLSYSLTLKLRSETCASRPKQSTLGKRPAKVNKHIFSTLTLFFVYVSCMSCKVGQSNSASTAFILIFHQLINVISYINWHTDAETKIKGETNGKKLCVLLYEPNQLKCGSKYYQVNCPSECVNAIPQIKLSLTYASLEKDHGKGMTLNKQSF